MIKYKPIDPCFHKEKKVHLVKPIETEVIEAVSNKTLEAETAKIETTQPVSKVKSNRGETGSESGLKPWLALGISRPTYYRRKLHAGKKDA